MRYLLAKAVPLVVLAGSLFGPDPILVSTDIRLCFGVSPSCLSGAAAGKMDDEVSVLRNARESLDSFWRAPPSRGTPDLEEGTKRRRHGDVILDPLPTGYSPVPMGQIMSEVLAGLIASGAKVPHPCWRVLPLLE